MLVLLMLGWASVWPGTTSQSAQVAGRSGRSRLKEWPPAISRVLQKVLSICRAVAAFAGAMLVGPGGTVRLCAVLDVKQGVPGCRMA